MSGTAPGIRPDGNGAGHTSLPIWPPATAPSRRSDPARDPEEDPDGLLGTEDGGGEDLSPEVVDRRLETFSQRNPGPEVVQGLEARRVAVPARLTLRLRRVE